LRIILFMGQFMRKYKNIDICDMSIIVPRTRKESLASRVESDVFNNNLRIWVDSFDTIFV